MEPHTHVRFGPFEVTSADGRLRRDGQPVPLQELPFRFLLALIRAAGAVVSREELCRELWGNTVVEYESGLNTAVRKLRDALDDDPAQPTYIETVPRRGYRLRVPVQHVAALSAPVQPPDPLEVRQRTSPIPGLLRWRWLSVSVVLGVLGLALFSALLSETVPARLIVLPVEGARDELAVARAWGLTDQLIAHLARLDPDRLVVLGPVTSRALDSRAASARQLGRDLGVTHVLAARLSDEPAPRLTVTITKASDESVVWSEILTEVADSAWPEVSARWTTLVARGALTVFGLEASETRVARASTMDTRAFDAYLRGRAAWVRFDAEGLRTSADAFRTAVALDAQFVDAHVGLAEALGMQALFQLAPADASFSASIESARVALRLAPDNPAGVAALAFGQFYSQADPAAAEDNFETALALDGGRALTHQWAAGFFSAKGQHLRSLALAARARELDPLSPSVNSDLCWYYYFAREYSRAATHAARAFEQFRQPGLLMCSQLAYWQLGDEHREREVLLERLTAAGRTADVEALSNAFSSGGMRGLRAADRHRLESSNLPEERYQRAVAALANGDTEHAVEILAQFASDRPAWFVFLSVDPGFDAVRSNLDFRRLLRPSVSPTLSFVPPIQSSSAVPENVR